MKKKLFFATGVAILTVAVSAFFYVNKEQNANYTLLNANVEALADVEAVLSGVCKGTYSNCSIPCPSCNIGLGAIDMDYGVVKYIEGTCPSCGFHVSLSML